MEIGKPTLFAVYSVWGNQWLRLAMFMQDWCDKINILVSTDSVLYSARRRYNELIGYGLFKGLLRTRRAYEGTIRKKSARYSYLSRFLDEFREPLPKIQSCFMLDSGGYGFTKLFSENKSNRLLNIRLPQLEKHWSNNTSKAQEAVLEQQAKLKPNILVTLDKVLFPKEPISSKRRKVRFSLNCARKALEKKKAGKLGRTKLFAAVHGYGPTVGDGSAQEYYETTKHYMESLLEFEDEIGVRFDGFSAGSLVPISSESILRCVGEAIQDTVHAEKRKAPLHALGASSDRKISTLYKYGFTMFDTNLHMKNARNRRIYDPDQLKYVSTRDVSKRDWSCSCRICSRYDWETITENRPHAREISTVLISLHNLFTNHLKLLEALNSNELVKGHKPAPKVES